MKALVIHNLKFDSRLTTLQHTLCFARHLYGFEVTYVNGLGLTDGAIKEERYDLAIVTYELVALRNTPYWRYISERVAPLLRNARVKIVMPQDDYSSSAFLDAFCVENQIDHIFSPLTKDLDMLYPGSLSAGIKFSEARTGYWEASTRLSYLSFQRPFAERSVDLGQRVRYLPPQLGPVAQRKGELALRFAQAARERGMTCDVSTRDADVLIGIDWWKFLGDIRFTVGRLGGASIADPYGRLAARVRQLQLRDPTITYEALARRLKTSKIPQGDFTATSPRLFECAAMGVCQILETGQYFEDFQPWRDYIPLEPEMENLEEVFAAMTQFERCEEIVRNAELSLISSGRYTYSRFCADLVKTTLGVDLSPDLGRPRISDVDAPLFESLTPAAVDEVKEAARRGLGISFRADKSLRSPIVTAWMDAFSQRRLIVESLTMPWSPAEQFLAES